MSNKNQISNDYVGVGMKGESEQTPNSYGTDSFSFFWLIFAGIGMLIYYVVEMINRVLFITIEASDTMWTIWRLVDSAYLALLFVPIGIQVLSWKRQNLGLESKKKISFIFFSVIGAGFFLAVYETLTELREELLDYSHRGDLTVPFLFMIILHIYGFLLLKNLITMIGRYKEVETGKSIFYILFAINPFVRYLLPFIILIFIQIGGGWATMFFAYSELVMTYISAVIAVGFFIMVIKDSRKIAKGHLLLNHDKIQKDNNLPDLEGVKLIEFQDKVIEVPIKKTVSVFCPKCGLVIYNDSKKCSNCGANIN